MRFILKVTRAFAIRPYACNSNKNKEPGSPASCRNLGVLPSADGNPPELA
jgi:hypothetical protein